MGEEGKGRGREVGKWGSRREGKRGKGGRKGGNMGEGRYVKYCHTNIPLLRQTHIKILASL